MKKRLCESFFCWPPRTLDEHWDKCKATAFALNAMLPRRYFHSISHRWLKSGSKQLEYQGPGERGETKIMPLKYLLFVTCPGLDPRGSPSSKVPILAIEENKSNLYSTKLSNLLWMWNSVSIGFGTSMKLSSLRQFKQYPTTSECGVSICECQVSFLLLNIRVHQSKVKPTLNSHTGCGVSFELPWWARFHSSVETFAYSVWHLS